MLVSNKKGMWLLVMSAARQINWKLVKSVVGKVELVALDQVPQITGCISGAVPPFGSVLGEHGIPTYMDSSLQEQGEFICFNAVSASCQGDVQGLRTNSIKMKCDDYLRLEKPTVASFTKWIVCLTNLRIKVALQNSH